MDLSTPS